METCLTLLSGICWCIVYEECIRLALKDKTYAMPFWALALNITWEGIYTYYDLCVRADVQGIVNVLWFCMDVIILALYFKYGRKQHEAGSDRLFYLWTILGVAAMFLVQFAYVKEFGLEGHLSAQYSAFAQNLIMSIAFIHMLIQRGNTKGQSMLLAIAKWIGTLAPTITMGIMSTNYVVLACGLLCTIYDLIYIVLLYRTKKREQLEAV
ncbi:MAG: hypothetical protein Q4E73_01770 [Lachnospiraceae bacterium]|nr:hypothetical protein [Lachnospiraceae bacterium]